MDFALSAEARACDGRQCAGGCRRRQHIIFPSLRCTSLSCTCQLSAQFPSFTRAVHGSESCAPALTRGRRRTSGCVGQLRLETGHRSRVWPAPENYNRREALLRAKRRETPVKTFPTSSGRAVRLYTSASSGLLPRSFQISPRSSMHDACPHPLSLRWPMATRSKMVPGSLARLGRCCSCCVLFPQGTVGPAPVVSCSRLSTVTPTYCLDGG